MVGRIGHHPRTGPATGLPAGSRLLTRTLGAVFLAAVVLAGCVPTSPSPTVRPQPEGRGRVAGVAVAPSAGCDPAGADTGTPPIDPESGTRPVRIEVGGLHRTAELRIPDGAGPHPLVVSLHPFTTGAAAWEDYSGLGDAALARGYVVATPTGSDPGPRWAVPGGLETGADDLGFLEALLEAIEDSLCIDRNAQFAAGYSAGAAMAQALSCTMPWRFAAVAGSGGTNLTETCPDSPPSDVLVLHGTADPIAPTSGSKVVFAPPLDLPVDEVVAVNARRAGCDPDPVASAPVADVEALTFSDCDDGHRVAYWRMLGAGHTWAGAEAFPGDLVVGPTPTSFSATEVILDLFDAT